MYLGFEARGKTTSSSWRRRAGTRRRGRGEGGAAGAVVRRRAAAADAVDRLGAGAAVDPRAHPLRLRADDRAARQRLARRRRRGVVVPGDDGDRLRAEKFGRETERRAQLRDVVAFVILKKGDT